VSCAVHRQVLPYSVAVPDADTFSPSPLQHLVWPPMQHVQLQHGSYVEVHIVYLQKALLLSGPKVAAQDLQLLLQQLSPDHTQVVVVKEHFLPLASCDVCTAAFARSAPRSPGAVQTRVAPSFPGCSCSMRLRPAPHMHT
jgi:hypothetical protein